jgi:hypothetical protein
MSKLAFICLLREKEREKTGKKKKNNIFLENNKSGKNKANFCPSQFPSVFSVLKANLRKKYCRSSSCQNSCKKYEGRLDKF